MNGFNAEAFLIGLIVIIISIALHEFGHAISADYLGDPGPRRDGRVTLWPDKHFDPFGFLMILFTLFAGFGLGWGKPVMVNPRYFKHPRRDMVIVAAFGPLMNLIQAIIAGLIIRFAAIPVPANGLMGRFVWMFLLTNLGLMFFNLIPIHPLDGSKILSGLLPIDLAHSYDQFVGRYGMMLILLFAFAGGRFIDQTIVPAVLRTAVLITGVPGLTLG